MFGDPSGTHTMVVYGDSHAGMWFQTLNSIAKSIGWRLAYLGKPWCPASSLPYPNPSGSGEYSACDEWHRFALTRINQLHPDLVIITQDFQSKPGGGLYSGTEWQEGLAKTISKIHVARSKVVVLGNMPLLPFDAPECLSHNVDDVQACSSDTLSFGALYVAEKSAAAEEGAHYVNVTRWFCSDTCPAVIDNYEVYFDQEHITAAYASFLAGVLARSLPLDLPKAFFGPPTTNVVVPTGGTIRRGRLFLDAIASANATSVSFELTGGRLHHRVISRSELGLIGWAGYWNSTRVPKGTYTLQSVATNFGNMRATSAGITIHLS